MNKAELEKLSNTELEQVYFRTFPMSTWTMPREVMISVLVGKGCDCTPVEVNGEAIHDLTCSLFDGMPLAAKV